MNQRSSRAKSPSCAVSIQGLILDLKIGVSEEERLCHQKIGIDIVLSYAVPPKGCITNNIDQVICYEEVCTKIRKLVEKKQFKLIESLTHYLYKKLKASYQDCLVCIKVTKHPKIKYLDGYVAFEIKD
jgi:dihydroneopterin aldolase